MKKSLGTIRPRSLRRPSTAIALGISAAALHAAPALAQDTEEVELETLQIEGRAADVNPNAELGAPYKARTSGDVRRTRPIAETPGTITVLTESQIDDSGYTDLVRILDAQPGITVGTGENGNQFGDRYIIRGQEARSDVFVDGLRDPGMTTRESFVVDQIEITKGPNSTFAGRGSAGGAINMITKAATTDYDFFEGTVGVGTDRYVRTTLDANIAVSDDLAVRANVLYGYTQTPDRGPTHRERKGLALSATYAPTDNFDLTLDYYGLRADDTPDIGAYIDRSTSSIVEVPVYAQEEDFQKSDVDVFTARMNFGLSDNIKLVNLTRYGMSDNGYVVTGASGTTTDATDPNGSYDTITFSTHQAFQEVEYFANQLNLVVESDFLGGHNDLIIGAEYTDHGVDNGRWNITTTGDTNCLVAGRGRPGEAAEPQGGYCGLGADGAAVHNINNLLGRDITAGDISSQWQVSTISGYVMDTLDLTESLTVFGGVRLDSFDFELFVPGNDRNPESTTYAYKDSFWNAHLGVSYEIGDLGMLYASFGTAADINGGESDVGTNSGYGGLVVIDGEFRGGEVERSINWELGGKFNLFDEKLLLTAAVFQTTKSAVLEGGGRGYTPEGTGNTGKNRVKGFELGIAGNLTPEWSFQGGLTLMDAEVLESESNPDSVGATLSNFADFQASFMTRYQLTDKFALGAAVKHKSERYAGQPDTAAGFSLEDDGSFTYGQPVPAYTVVDLFAEYRFNRNLQLRVNVNNLYDTKYYLAAYRSGTFVYKGDGQQAVATITMRY